MQALQLRFNVLKPRPVTADGEILALLSEVQPSYLLRYITEWPPLRSSVQSSWPQIQRSGFDSWRYQIFWEVVGPERGPLSLVSTIEELLGRKNSCSGLESQEYGRRGTVTLTMWHPLSVELGINFANKRRSLGRYSSLTNSGHGVFTSQNVPEGLWYVEVDDICMQKLWGGGTPPYIINESLSGSRASPLVILPVTLS
jgi:hypothetical protein